MSRQMRMTVEPRPHFIIDIEQRYLFRVVPERDPITLTGVVPRVEAIGKIDASVIEALTRLAVLERTNTTARVPLEELRAVTRKLRGTIDPQAIYNIALAPLFDAIEARLARLEDLVESSVAGKEK